MRVYALVLPHVWITAAADRETTIVGLLTPIEASLGNRVNALPDGAVKTNDLQLLGDMNSKLNDARSQATTAENAVVNLAPDNGNATIAASNKAAITGALVNVATGQNDLQGARGDAATVQQTLPAPAQQ